MSVTTYAVRFSPGSDLKVEIEKLVQHYQIKAGWIQTCVGSLTRFNLRFANQKSGIVKEGHFEIVSLVGTIAINGCHLHTCVSDHAGTTIGGHLLEGCVVYTTVEIVLASTDEFSFNRRKDEITGWNELEIQRANQNT